jgi:hypothetical protein
MDAMETRILDAALEAVAAGAATSRSGPASGA